jgi:hypothetical protein
MAEGFLQQDCLKKAQSCCLLAERAVEAEERKRWLRLAEYWVAQSATDPPGGSRQRQQRRHKRKPVRRRCWIALANDKLVECFVEDMSEGGAKLVFKDFQPPKRFRLLFSPTSPTCRFCEIRWQTLEAVGIQFVSEYAEEMLDEVISL